MRIIAGRYRGHPISAPAGRTVRPTTDRVREALFSILGASVEGAAVLDLFAGSGALGLEALSRGAARAVFVEASPRSLAVLHKNIERLGVEGVRVAKGRVEDTLPRLARDGETFDLVFLDPPYHKGLATETIERLGAGTLLRPGARVVAEHEADGPPPELPAGGLVRDDTRRYGDTALSFYRTPTEAP
ncbi:MAG: 16S rRNA (guanine(966)-N(2))-methyltransferase RsmD [Pseudomonadota bacterium]